MNNSTIEKSHVKIWANKHSAKVEDTNQQKCLVTFLMLIVATDNYVWKTILF